MYPQTSVYLDSTAPMPVWASFIAVAIFFLVTFGSLAAFDDGPPPPTCVRRAPFTTVPVVQPALL